MGFDQGHQSPGFYAGLVEKITDHALLATDIAFGLIIVEAEQKPLPANLRRVWRWFWDLNEGRQSHHDLIPDLNDDRQFCWRTRRRIERFSHSEIMAWQINSGIELEQWEMAALHLMDEIYTRAYSAASDPHRQVLSSRKFDVEVFDALFAGK